MVEACQEFLEVLLLFEFLWHCLVLGWRHLYGHRLHLDILQVEDTVTENLLVEFAHIIDAQTLHGVPQSRKLLLG